jgi:hypothetical protein
MPYIRKYHIYSKPVYKSSIIKKVHNHKPKKKKSKKKSNWKKLKKYWKKKTPDFSKKRNRNQLYRIEAEIIAGMLTYGLGEVPSVLDDVFVGRNAPSKFWGVYPPRWADFGGKSYGFP